MFSLAAHFRSYRDSRFSFFEKILSLKSMSENDSDYPPPCMRVPGRREADLVDLKAMYSGFKLDIRYATSENFVKQPVYREARAFLQRPAAEALCRVAAKLADLGFGIVIFDGYRPWSVTKKFWDLTPIELHEFVANPVYGSKHNRGCAVDVTLYRIDKNDNSHVEMPCDFDDMTDKAHSEYKGDPSVLEFSAEYDVQSMQLKHRDILRGAMEGDGDFSVQDNEWWHFNYKDWQEYPVLDIPFEDIPR
jgi:D-alanyl-D-alanine dipeptidase